jgi:hypothetical protein
MPRDIRRFCRGYISWLFGVFRMEKRPYEKANSIRIGERRLNRKNAIKHDASIPEGRPTSVRMECLDSILDQTASNSVLQLKSEPPSTWNMGTTNEREVRMVFNEDPTNAGEDESRRSKTLVRDIGNINSFTLQMPEMETNAEVISGTIFLNVNDFTWTFDVPRQISKWGLVTMQYKKDSNGYKKAEILPRDIISPFGGQKVGHFDGK